MTFDLLFGGVLFRLFQDHDLSIQALRKIQAGDLDLKSCDLIIWGLYFQTAAGPWYYQYGSTV